MEHVLFTDLHGNEMFIPSVSVYDQVVLYARKESYRSIAANFHGPNKYEPHIQCTVHVHCIMYMLIDQCTHVLYMYNNYY